MKDKVFPLRMLRKHTITQHHDERGRYYEYERRKYTSVTTFLGQTSDQSFLDVWRKKIGNEEADRVLKQTTRRGNSIHDQLERYVLGQPQIDTSYKSLTNIIKKKLNAHLGEVYGVEIPLASHKLRLAGTCDLVGLYKGKISVIDYKGSNKPKKIAYIENYILQCIIYAFMIREMYGIRVEQLVILVAVASNISGQEFIIDEKDFTKYLHILRERHLSWTSESELTR